MPTYEFECKKCHHRFDLKRTYGDFSDAACPECRGTAVRCFVPVPVIFKGSGFYVTDHRKPSPPESGAASLPSAESKPATGT